MLTIDLGIRFGVALLLGALIGLEREKAMAKFSTRGFAGIRTFIFISLLGCISGFMTDFTPFSFPLMSFGALIFLIGIAYYISSLQIKDHGLTTEITAILAFILGLLCFYTELITPVILAIIITVVLSFKDPMHSLVKKIKREELYATLKFAIIAFVILPFLPNKAYGPLGVFNPYNIWLMVVFVSGISYFGYIIMRLIGSKKGIALTGLVGGFASSTAVTMSLSEQSKRNPSIINQYFVGIVLASTIMFARILFVVTVLNPSLFNQLVIPITCMGVTSLLFTALMYFRKKKKKAISKEVKMQSPFSIGPALKFGALFAIILFVAKLGHKYFGEAGLYIASLISGIADVDAITLSVANLANNSITLNVAAIAIIIAASTNTLVKAGIVWIFGSRRLAKKVLFAYVIVVTVGLATALLL